MGREFQSNERLLVVQTPGEHLALSAQGSTELS